MLGIMDGGIVDQVVRNSDKFQQLCFRLHDEIEKGLHGLRDLTTDLGDTHIQGTLQMLLRS